MAQKKWRTSPHRIFFSMVLTLAIIFTPIIPAYLGESQDLNASEYIANECTPLNTASSPSLTFSNKFFRCIIHLKSDKNMNISYNFYRNDQKIQNVKMFISKDLTYDILVYGFRLFGNYKIVFDFGEKVNIYQFLGFMFVLN